MLGCIGSESAPDEATLKEESHALQSTMAGPYNAVPTDLLRAGDPYAGSAVIYMEYISSVSLPVPEQLPVLVQSSMALRKSGLHVNSTMLLFKLPRLHGKRGS